METDRLTDRMGLETISITDHHYVYNINDIDGDGTETVRVNRP